MSEKPIECSHCKKSIKTIYQEIVGHSITCLEMCADCPILQQKLRGSSSSNSNTTQGEGKDTTLCCANCMTTLESIKTGNPLGCSHCYAIFEDILVEELLSQDKLPSRIPKEMGSKHSLPLHLGKSPETTLPLSPSIRLTSLNEALNEALKKENYEQAAWLRDQIKELSGESSERSTPPT
jgi:protein arginine kinase activator